MDKIERMEKELEYIKFRVDSLERRLQEEKQKQYKQRTGNTVYELVQRKAEKVYSQTQDGMLTYKQADLKETETYQGQRQEDGITESKIGTYALPIAAVILILIGIGFLSVLAWNIVGNIGKAGIVAAMGVVSLTAGMIFGRSEHMKLFKYSMFSVALTIFYADIVLMNFTWHLIPIPVVILLILLWSGINIVLSKRYNEKLFYYILETGICVASFLLTDIEMSGSTGVLSFLLPFCMFGISYYMYTKQFNNGNNIFGITGLILIYFQIMMVNKVYYDSALLHEPNMPYEVSKYAMLLISLVFALFYDKMITERNNPTQNTRAAVVKCFIALLLPLGVYSLLSFMEEYVGAALALITCVLILREKKDRGLLTLFVHPAAAYILFNLFEYYWDYGMLAFVVLSALTYFFYVLDDSKIPFVEYIITQNLLTFLWIFIYGGFSIRHTSEALSLGIPLILTDVGIMFYAVKQKRHIDFQLTGAFFLLGTMEFGYILADLQEKDSEMWIAVTMVVILILLSFVISYIKHTDDKSIAPYLFTGVFEQVLIGNYLDFDGVPALSVIETIIILTTVLFGYVFDIHKRQSTAKEIVFYVLGTFNILFVLSETPIWDMSVVLSLILVGLAASAIVTGFKIQRKSFRIYGLVLLIISILKMVLFDWDGEDLWIRVFSFIGAGIICLILSYLYNRLEKSLESEKKDEGQQYIAD